MPCRLLRWHAQLTPVWHAGLEELVRAREMEDDEPNPVADMAVREVNEVAIGGGVGEGEAEHNG